MATRRDISNITLEGVRILFRNFAGEERQFNPKGKRNFCAIIDEDLAKTLKKDGWNIKVLRPRDEGDQEQCYIPVEVRYNSYPPKIIMVTSNGQTMLTEETVSLLDTAEIKNVDLIIRPYEWEPGKVKAYVKTMYVTIEEDDLERKYYTPATASIADDDDLF
jgi:hypothetical protein